MSTTSAFPGALDEFWNIADDPFMDEGGRLATDIITELQNAIAAVQGSLGVTSALNYMRATGSVVQTVSGAKTFSSLLTANGGVRTPWVEFSTQRNSLGGALQVFGGGAGNNFSRIDAGMQTGAWRYDHTGGDSGGPVSERGVIYHSQRTSGGGETQLYVGEVTGQVWARARVTGSWTDWRQLAPTIRASFGSAGVGSFPANGALATLGGRAYLGSASDLYALCLCFSAARAAGGTGYYLGATDSAAPALVLSNVGGVERARLTDAGHLGLGGQTSPAAAIDNAGSSKLGPLAPPCRWREYTGTFGSAGVLVTIAHGLPDHTKIVFSQGHFNHAGGERRPFTADFAVSLVADSIDLRMVPSSPAAGRTFSVLIGVKD